MPFDVLGRMLFPGLQPWERRRKIKVILGVLLTAVIFGGVVGAMIYEQGKFHH